MTTLSDQRYEDLRTFAHAMLASRDLDPIYDVLRALYAQLGLSDDTQHWFTVLYLAYYNLPSALRAYDAQPHPAPLPDHLAYLPTAVERRNLRGGQVAAHLDHVLALAGRFPSIRAFVTQGWKPHTPEDNFLRFWDTAQLPWGNGRWAAFKWADLLKNVHQLPISAPDMRMQHCSGPKEGLQRLYGIDTNDVPTLDRLGGDLRFRLAQDGLMLDWEQLETVLCNFKSLDKGKYYVGHDIDELQERINHADLPLHLRSQLYRARAEALPLAYLGERRGWNGIQKGRMAVYHTDGTILTRGGVA